MEQASTTSILTAGEACSLVYQYLYHRLDRGRRRWLGRYHNQFTATSLGSNRWHVFTWLAGLGQWNVSYDGTTLFMEPVDTIAGRLEWGFQQGSEEDGLPDA